MDARTLAIFCYDAYDIITRRPLEERDHEGHFPEEFDILMGRFEIDSDDFQNEWNDCAGYAG